MRQVIRYESHDGVLWMNEEQALKRDSILLRVNNALSLLKETPSCFQGYYQQDFLAVAKVRIVAVELSKEEYDNPIWTKTSPDKINAAMASEYLLSNSPVRNLWYRLMRIDEKGREWEQVYYVLNPDKAPMIELK